ncbi:hypothetical protein [Photobacterium damselae]|uniref:hypothetical protein n=1 Tax=Photobacterium damselae TaxID=38293 RepID=UPI000D06DCFA|nr:hypothetical protein [Photobacterium damselae]NVO73211.1 hypothetical protein [Photobacterium damselae subsp. damselae]PSB81797.1 hypothetical protein C5F61_01190 [Photobacterium damselae subsp. damselae]PSB82993.1 hypothetical protein C5F62_08585 [Photobacterium damselae subsp. damselae]TGZ34014.1 hypothetical protein EQ875_02580 [Photobacterium damselae subsp. damselae]UKA28962.1 hypothetical protein IPQ37_13195 [Photobacterium damselae subsp. damselae]
MSPTELGIIKYALELGLTPEFALMSFLAFQMYKLNKKQVESLQMMREHFARMIAEHDKRIAVIEAKN